MQWQKKTAPVREGLRAKAGSAVERQTPVPAGQRAVDEGRKPLTSRRKDLAALRAKVAELYGVPAAGLTAIPAIESQFQFSQLASDAGFNYLHVDVARSGRRPAGSLRRGENRARPVAPGEMEARHRAGSLLSPRFLLIIRHHEGVDSFEEKCP